MEVKFYVCKHCGNVIAYLERSGVDVVCCGEKMQELVPNTSDGAGEKHLPIISQEGNIVTVEVSSVEHPSLPAHYIKWIALQTEKEGMQRRILAPGDKPVAQFALIDGDKAVAAYEYCNLHGLWANKL